MVVVVVRGLFMSLVFVGIPRSNHWFTWSKCISHFVAYHQIIAGNSKHRKICWRNFVCIRQKHPVFHRNTHAQLHQITFSVHSGDSFGNRHILSLKSFQASPLNTSSPRSEISVNCLLNSVTVGAKDHVSYHSKWWYFKWINRKWNRYPSTVSKILSVQI